MVTISVNHEKLDGTQVTRTLPLLLPHKILQYLFTQTELHIDPRVIDKYWSHLREVQHPWAMNSEASLLRFIPVGLHGDEASYGADRTAPDKLTCIFLDLPLWRPKNARLFACDSHQLVGYESLHPVLQRIVESLNFAYAGVDGSGCDVVVGKRFVVSEIRGDLAWHRFIWRMHRWWRAREICWKCSACSRDGPLYFEHGDSAAWRQTHINTVTFIAEGLPDDLLCASSKFSV